MPRLRQLATWWRHRRWWVRWLAYFAAVVVTFYVVEDVRGYLALKKAKAEYLAAGYRLDLDEILGPPIPDEENFAMHPLIRGLYDGGNDELGFFPENLLPGPTKHSKERIRGYHGRTYSVEDYVESTEDPGTFLKEATNALRRAMPTIAEFNSATERPDCDWTQVTDLTDFAGYNHHAIPILEIVKAAEVRNAVAVRNPEFALRESDIVALIASSRHCKTKNTLVSQLVGEAVAHKAIGFLTSGIRDGTWETEELLQFASALRQFEEESDWKDFIEVEAAAVSALYDDSRKARASFGDPLMFAPSPIIQLPKNNFVDFGEAEQAITRALIRFMPRGWLWQNQARYLDLIRDDRVGYGSSLYSLLVYDFVGSISSVRERWLKNFARLNLALIAIDLEIAKLETGTYPDPSEFPLPSDQFGYQIGKNGRPVIWYSETGPAAETLAPEDFDLVPHEHLWLYP